MVYSCTWYKGIDAVKCEYYMECNKQDLFSFSNFSFLKNERECNHVAIFNKHNYATELEFYRLTPSNA